MRPMDLLRDADTAMYRAKAAGQGRHEVFDSAMQAHAVRAAPARVRSPPRDGRDEIRLLYHPVVSLTTAPSWVSRPSLAGSTPLAGSFLLGFPPRRGRNGLIVELGFQVLRRPASRFSTGSGAPAIGAPPIHVNCPTSSSSSRPRRSRWSRSWPRPSFLPGSGSRRFGERRHAESRLLGRDSRPAQEPRPAHPPRRFGTGYSSLGYLHRFGSIPSRSIGLHPESSRREALAESPPHDHRPRRQPGHGVIAEESRPRSSSRSFSDSAACWARSLFTSLSPELVEDILS
jgi:hypothetical protein